MKKIAIVDDNREYLKEIRTEIGSSNWGYPVEIDLYENSDQFLSSLRNGKRYDLCLSDIEMPGKNGIELAGEIREPDPYMLLIYLTAYTKYAVLGYKVEAFDYILKSHFKQEWKRVLEKIKKEFEKSDCDFYFVQTPNYFEKISLSQVLYIYKDKKYAVFVLDEREIAVRKSLKQIREELAGKDQFILIERGYIANIEKIKRFEQRGIELVNGQRLPLGNIRTAEVMEKINSYWAGYRNVMGIAGDYNNC